MYGLFCGLRNATFHQVDMIFLFGNGLVFSPAQKRRYARGSASRGGGRGCPQGLKGRRIRHRRGQATTGCPNTSQGTCPRRTTTADTAQHAATAPTGNRRNPPDFSSFLSSRASTERRGCAPGISYPARKSFCGLFCTLQTSAVVAPACPGTFSTTPRACRFPSGLPSP